MVFGLRNNMINNIILKITTAILLGIVLIACGGRDNSPTTNTTKDEVTISGKAVDGYISGATVCLDMNGDDSCDSDEPTTTTNVDGTYTLNVDVTGTYTILILGGIDTATYEVFEGTLKDIVELDDSTTQISKIITPLTTVAAEIYKEEIKTNVNYSISTAKQTLADSLGITKEQIEADPLTDISVYTKTQQIVQTVNLLKKSIQTDETDTNKNNAAFSHIIIQIAHTLKEETSGDFNISKVVAQLETTTYENTSITIPEEIKTYAEGISTDISIKTQNVSLENLDYLQNTFSQNTNEAKTAIENDTTSTLVTKLKEIEDTSSESMIEAGETESSTISMPPEIPSL